MKRPIDEHIFQKDGCRNLLPAVSLVPHHTFCGLWPRLPYAGYDIEMLQLLLNDGLAKISLTGRTRFPILPYAKISLKKDMSR